MDFDDEDAEFRVPIDWSAPRSGWAQPRFEAVFAFLHPFFKVPLELCKYIEREGNRWLEPGGYEKLMNSPIDHVTWAQVMKGLNISSYGFLNDIVNGHAVGAFALKTASSHDIERLDSHLRTNNMISPQTHYLPTTLKPQIKESIARFGTGNPKWSASPYEKENLLYATPYECADSFICGPRAILNTLVQTYNFEGFFAGPNTKVDLTLSEEANSG